MCWRLPKLSLSISARLPQPRLTALTNHPIDPPLPGGLED